MMREEIKEEIGIPRITSSLKKETWYDKEEKNAVAKEAQLTHNR